MLRYLTNQVQEDLKRKMVFVGGPRQVGKTTLAKQIPGAKKGYLNWDVDSDRSFILEKKLPTSSLWVFDEIHKYRRWRNYIKSIYDSRAAEQKILVTGSASLDYYRFGGDSLQGRYHYLRLHPLSVGELAIKNEKDFNALLKLGGFPEPFLGGSEREARRWSRQYRSRLIREEITSLEQVQDLGSLELLMMRLPNLVGSPLSVNALAEDLQVAHKTIVKWLAVLERLYAVFRLAPYGGPTIRAVKKAQKHYHFNWSTVAKDDARFENLVASHLLKWTHYQQDVDGSDIELRYVRDVEGREVDFAVVENNKILKLIECKNSDRDLSRSLRYFKARFKLAEAYQISATGKNDYLTPEGIRVCPAVTFLRELV